MARIEGLATTLGKHHHHGITYGFDGARDRQDLVMAIWDEKDPDAGTRAIRMARPGSRVVTIQPFQPYTAISSHGHELPQIHALTDGTHNP